MSDESVRLDELETRIIRSRKRRKLNRKLKNRRKLNRRLRRKLKLSRKLSRLEPPALAGTEAAQTG